MPLPILPDSLRYTVEEFDDEGVTPVDILAACQHIDAIRAAYEALVAKFPDKKLAICQRMRILTRNFDRPK